jgi:chloramphenicol 3-O-phosphotransferase
MTRSAKKVFTILKRAGVHVSGELRVERTYAGRNQRAQGWAVWIAREASGHIVCGGDTSICKLHIGQVDVYEVGGERWISPR